jgi:hypothetical protein
MEENKELKETKMDENKEQMKITIQQLEQMENKIL